jgi:putative phage-type endonuclease
MNIRIVECEQRTPEWFAARAGRLTGSVADAILAKLKSGGEPAARRDLRTLLAIEQITGAPAEVDSFINREMQRGIDLEPAALAAYEAETGRVVRKTGFITHVELQIGCSLDGDVDDLKGIVELKCPKSATHVSYLRAGRMPPDYVPQVTHNLWVTGAEYCDFVSYDDRLPEGLQFFRVRVARADVDLKGYEAEARRFLAEVKVEVNELLSLRAAA